MAEKAGWQYLKCIYENYTQASNVWDEFSNEGWILVSVDGLTVNYKRRLFHSPGWYAVIDYGLHCEEYGPFSREADIYRVFDGENIINIKYYNIDKPWKNRFELIGEHI